MLSNNPKISVIIPAYNIAEYLPRCLDSVIDQTYKNLEIIVISDGSTDKTNDIIKEYEKKDSRIVAILKENSGVSDTRNKGLDIATGDYIGFVDGDDYIEPESYYDHINHFIKPVYYNMAKDIVDVINKYTDSNVSETSKAKVTYMKLHDFIGETLAKIKRKLRG